ncbi:MAG: PSD1 domain-containing protein [Bryobacterales bacterium]|nr:PSD1 domain-containing protein [Bryobacterales bacterium]
MPRIDWNTLAGVLLLCPFAVAQNPSASSPDFFENRIRPILANNCYGCHTESNLGGLRLDSSDAMRKGGKRGPAVVPGDPSKSILMTAVRHTDSSLKMPMGNKLKNEEIDALDQWIKAGAVWPAAAPAAAKSASLASERRNFWSFQPLKDPQPPTVKDVRWPKTNIDRFVLAKLEKEGLKPVRAASKRDLIRRATLDLTGLPPTPEEIAAFESDTSPKAFEAVVNRLLASPHYGERWGRIWLDVARYGEDDYRSLDPMRRGYNPYPNAFLYRDWIVQAFNDDLPFDRFVKAQLAGDLMDEKERHKTLAGTGFLGLGPWYYDNGAVEVTRADERHDRVDVVTRGFLGLTVGCARCHDHKYDPISAEDYYALGGVFLNSTYHEYPQVPQSVLAKYKKIEDEIEKKQKLLMGTQKTFSDRLSQSLALQTASYLQAVWEVSGPRKKEMPTVVEERKLDFELLDRWVRYMAKVTDKYAYKEPWQSMMKKGGTAAEAKKVAEAFQADVIRIMLAKEDLAEENEIITAKSLEGTTKKKRANKPNEFITNDDFCPGCGLQLKSMPEKDMAFWTEVFQRELSDSDDPNAMMAMGGRMGKPGVLMFRNWGLETRIGSESQNMLASMRKDIEDTRKKLEPYYPYVHGVRDADKCVDLRISIRGNPENLGPEVPRRFLSVLSPENAKPFAKGSGRMELAEAIINQPLSLRVFVNRIWKAHFETGIVDTPSNFGLTGEKPTNPDLLEYLASSFRKNGLSVKSLHREIMLSTTYQLSAENDAAAFDKDPANRLYWRANRKRMDAEQIRDSILFASGKLDKSLGGPSTELAPSFNRRTIYGKVSRYNLDEYLQLWDFPSPSISAEKRFTTTVPLQRLFLMNSDFVQSQAETLAKRVAGESDNRARIRKLYQILYGRLPLEAEIQAGLNYLSKEPMLEFEESRKKQSESPALPQRKADPSMLSKAAPSGAGPSSAEPSSAEPGEGQTAGAADEPPVSPMLAGLAGFGFGAPRQQGPPPPPPVEYTPTAWGRYAKVLLSSSEFLYIN